MGTRQRSKPHSANQVIRAVLAAGLLAAVIPPGAVPPAVAQPQPPAAAPQAPWTLPVPAGTTIHEIEPTPASERNQRRLALVPDLVIEERGDDVHYVFGARPPSVTVDPGGNIYVAEPMPRTGRVLMFDPDGEFVRQIGRAGQGPGEYLQPFSVEWVGDHNLFVFDPGQGSITIWGPGGEPAGGARGTTALRRFRSLRGLPDGALIGTEFIRTPDGEFDEGRVAIRRVDGSLEQQVEYVRAPSPVRIIDPGFGEQARAEPNAFHAGATAPGIAVADDGTVYVSTLDEYQIVAYAPGGEIRWALRSEWPRLPLDEGEIDWLMEFHNIRFPERRRSAIEWPETQYALGDIKVDGRGRLYVFPYVPRGAELDGRPVDVYSPDGELLFAGVIDTPTQGLPWQSPPANGPMMARAWQEAAGDLIYGIVADPETTEWQVVRHRIAWPD